MLDGQVAAAIGRVGDASGALRQGLEGYMNNLGERPGEVRLCYTVAWHNRLTQWWVHRPCHVSYRGLLSEIGRVRPIISRRL